MTNKDKIFIEILRVGTIHARNHLENRPEIGCGQLESAKLIIELLHGIPPLLLDPNTKGDIYFLNSAISPFVIGYKNKADAAFTSIAALVLELEKETQKVAPFNWKISPEVASDLKT